ncbi:MAG: diguanylate cyclase [Acidobacteriota bacterium]|jgi:diguanylate cyclase (GGDEF)-like protein/PAS domain S-box-containing protein|nr:diguanylate cyclase [Acidobacteriota bacterium]
MMTVDNADFGANIDASILDALGDGIFCVDGDMNVLRWNRAAKDLTGFAPDDLAGNTCRGNLQCRTAEDDVARCSDGCPLQATIADGQSRSVTLIVRNRRAEKVPLLAKTVPIFADRANRAGEGGGAAAALAILSPYAEGVRGRREDALPGLILTDPCTGLYNRIYFEGELAGRIARWREDDVRTALSLVSIDGFHALGDAYGREACDDVLRKTAQALEAGFRKTDVFCRWGEDQFICLHDFSAAGDPGWIGGKLQKTVAGVKIDWYGKALGVEVSIGVTEIRAGDTMESVIGRVDELMRRSRRDGRNRCSVA